MKVKIKTSDGEPRFPCLTSWPFFPYLHPMLSLREDFQCSEKSTLTLKQSTIISLMAIKSNGEECCHNAKFTDELLKRPQKCHFIVNKYNINIELDNFDNYVPLCNYYNFNALFLRILCSLLVYNFYTITRPRSLLIL